MRYRFDRFELDRARFRLLREGQPQPVEPKVLELLLYLIENRERLVPKRELVEEVWKGRSITDGALSRCLYQARKVLGDTSADQRFLTTVHGRGVRFTAGVEVTEIPTSADSAPPTATDKSEAVPPTHLRWRRSGLVAILLGAVGLAALALVRVGDPADRPGEAGAETAVEADGALSLALMPISIHAEQSPELALEGELDLLALSLSDLLHSRLATVPEWRLRPLSRIREEATSASSLRAVANRAGATHLVTGSLRAASDGRSLLDLEIFEVRPERPVRSTPLGRFAVPLVRSTEDFAELIRLRDAMAERVVEVLGSPFTFDEPEPGGTRDAEAWRLYVLAYQRLSDDFCAGSRPALALLERALERDPAFGKAWEAVAVAYYNRVWACGESAALYDRVFDALERAATVAPELRTPRFTRITLWIETGRIEQAYEAILEERAARPDDPLALNAQAYALRYAGFLEPSATALDRVLEIDPLAFAVGTLGGSPNTYLYQGRYERFLEAVPVSGMAYHRWYRGFTQLLTGSADLARQTLEPAFRESPGQIFGRLSHALLAVLDDDPEGAVAIVSQISRQRQELGAVDAEITLKQAQVLALAGAADRALDELERTVDGGFFCVRCLALDPSLDAVRGDPRWNQILIEARRRHLAFGERFGLSPELD